MWTAERVLAAIIAWVELYGEPPTQMDWDPARARRNGQSWRVSRYRSGQWPCLATVAARFGNLTSAVRATGIEPRLHGQRDWERTADVYSHAPGIMLVTADEARFAAELGRRARQVAAMRTADPQRLRQSLVALGHQALAWANHIARDAEVDRGRATSEASA